MKPKKIVSFGDSFVFGSELANNLDGRRAWPGLVAHDLGWNYETLACPGCGNDAIARQIYHYFANNDTSDVLAIVNWTWFMRWDFYIARNHETWITLGPTCVPQKLQHLVDTTQSHQIVDFYTSFANDSILWNKMRNLQTIFAAQQYLSVRGITNIQTYMDPHTIDTKLHSPDYICELQSLIVPNLQTWEGMTFLDWCRSYDFEITDPLLHPLEDAHAAAADFWRTKYAQTLTR